MALAVKFVALAVIWNLWFAHPASKRLDPPDDRRGGLLVKSRQ